MSSAYSHHVIPLDTFVITSLLTWTNLGLFLQVGNIQNTEYWCDSWQYLHSVVALINHLQILAIMDVFSKDFNIFLQETHYFYQVVGNFLKEHKNKCTRH